MVQNFGGELGCLRCNGTSLCPVAAGLICANVVVPDLNQIWGLNASAYEYMKLLNFEDNAPLNVISCSLRKAEALRTERSTESRIDSNKTIAVENRLPVFATLKEIFWCL